MADKQSAVQRSFAVASPYLKGPDVKAYQQAVNKVRAALKLSGRCTEDGEFGVQTATLGDRTAYALGLEAAGDSPHHISRIVTQDEQRLVRDPSKRTEQQKDRSVRRVKELLAQQIAHDNVRSKIVTYAAWGVTNEPAIHYAQIRPYPSATRGLPMHTDCSGFATLAYKDAGGPDPNGRGFDGFGFTGTILTACRHIPKASAKPGDLIVYGAYPGTHVVILVQPGTVADPLCVSHGQEAGPIRVAASVEARAHSGQAITYCQILD